MPFEIIHFYIYVDLTLKAFNKNGEILMVEKVRAAVLVKPRKMEIRKFPYPKDLPEDGMIVKMEMSGICGTDKHVWEGHGFGPAEPYVDVPLILGHENVGRVHEIGEKAAKEMEVRGRELKEGDRVTWYPAILCGKCYYCRRFPAALNLCERMMIYGYTNCEKPEYKPWLYGGWAEYVYLKPGSWVWKVSDKIPLEAVAMLDTLVSVRIVETAASPLPNLRLGFGFGDTVVVQGSGPIGMCAATKARVFGASRVIMVGAPEHRLELAKRFGVDETINIEQVKTANERVQTILNLTEGRGADMVIDCTGIPAAVPEGIDMVRRGGTFLEIGCFTDRGTVPVNPQYWVFKDIRILGQWYAGPQQYDRDLTLIESRKFPYEKMVTHKFTIEEAQRALAASEKLEPLKAVIIP